MVPFFVKLRSGSLVNLDLVTEISPDANGGTVLSIVDGASIVVPEPIEDFEHELLDAMEEDYDG